MDRLDDIISPDTYKKLTDKFEEQKQKKQNEIDELKIDEKFLDLYTKYGFDVVAPDQDYINAMCYGHIKYLKDENGTTISPAVSVDSIFTEGGG